MWVVFALAQLRLLTCSRRKKELQNKNPKHNDPTSSKPPRAVHGQAGKLLATTELCAAEWDPTGEPPDLGFRG